MKTQVIVQAIGRGIPLAKQFLTRQERTAFLMGLACACEYEVGVPVEPLRQAWDLVQDALEIETRIVERDLDDYGRIKT